MDLAHLIHYSRTGWNQRIRFTTSHPEAFSQTLVDAYAEEPKLANQLHLRIQSGSNRILTAMKRGYQIDRFYDIVNQIKGHRPDISITSDFIVGFPEKPMRILNKHLN